MSAMGQAVGGSIVGDSRSTQTAVIAIVVVLINTITVAFIFIVTFIRIKAGISSASCRGL